MPLTAMQKSQIRRHLKYPNVGFSSVSPGGGGGTLGANMSYQSSSYFGLLELKMDNLQPCDEATLIGKAFASFNLLGPVPAAGDEVVLTFANLAGASGPLASTPYQKTVVCTVDEAGDLDKFALLIAASISKDSTLASAGFQALAPYGPGSNVLNPMTEIGITNDQTFKLTATNTGGFGAGVMDDGSVLPEPAVEVAKTAGVPVMKYGYLPLMNYLYAAIATATRRQGTLQADVFKARQDEVAARKELYEIWRKELANFLDVPLNPTAKGSQQNYGQIVL